MRFEVALIQTDSMQERAQFSAIQALSLLRFGCVQPLPKG